MYTESPAEYRHFLTKQIECDLVIVGGGVAGTCCALTAARAGVKVALIQDRPVLGGNASSEVRLWMLGATSHGGNNNRWAREGGVIDEIIVENTYRNPEGNPVIFDTVLLEKVYEEPNITLLLNTFVFEVHKATSDMIAAVRAFNSQNSTMYEVQAPLFCDATGDGAVGFLAGAAFRMGAEPQIEFGEKLAPDEEYGELLGHTIFFYSKDTGKPVRFIAPSFALKNVPEQIPRFRNFQPETSGCKLWWIEYGGRLDTVHDNEAIKWELWKVAYGAWNYIKNSGQFPEAETLTLEWIGTIPGKRESRRFEGDYLLRQQDLIEQHQHEDAVSHGGWALDLHPADGVYSEKPGCNQWHSRGTYQIPYRCMYSRNISNLFLAGRILSASHVAFGSTRVQATLGEAAQAVGLAAALCLRDGKLPAQMCESADIKELQRELLRRGQCIPGVRLDDPHNLAAQAKIQASSTLQLTHLPDNGPLLSLSKSWAQMLPVQAGAVPTVTLMVDVSEATDLRLELRTSDRPTNYTSDVLLAAKSFELAAGPNQSIVADFKVELDEARYLFLCVMQNPAASVHCSAQRLTGILSIANGQNPAVSNYGRQEPQAGIGVETFEFWCPERRPDGQNFAFILDPPLTCFGPENVFNGWQRPTSAPNAWVAAFDDAQPTLSLEWDQSQTITQIYLGFDTDFDHPMESVQWGHPEAAMPFCVKHYRIKDGDGNVLAERDQNYQTRNWLTFDTPITTERLFIEILESHGDVPAAIFEVACYAERCDLIR